MRCQLHSITLYYILAQFTVSSQHFAQSSGMQTPPLLHPEHRKTSRPDHVAVPVPTDDDGPGRPAGAVHHALPAALRGNLEHLPQGMNSHVSCNTQNTLTSV